MGNWEIIPTISCPVDSLSYISIGVGAGFTNNMCLKQISYINSPRIYAISMQLNMILYRLIHMYGGAGAGLTNLFVRIKNHL